MPSLGFPPQHARREVSRLPRWIGVTGPYEATSYGVPGDLPAASGPVEVAGISSAPRAGNAERSAPGCWWVGRHGTDRAAPVTWQAGWLVPGQVRCGPTVQFDAGVRCWSLVSGGRWPG